MVIAVVCYNHDFLLPGAAVDGQTNVTHQNKEGAYAERLGRALVGAEDVGSETP